MFTNNVCKLVFRLPAIINTWTQLCMLVSQTLYGCLTSAFNSRSREEIELPVGFIDWVTQYEKYVFFYFPLFLAAWLTWVLDTTINTIQSVLPSVLLLCMDLFTLLQASLQQDSWAFPIERYCGILQPAIKSWHHPFASLDWHVLEVA